MAEQKPESKKKGCLGCSLPLAIGLIVVVVAISVFGIMNGAFGSKTIPAPAVELPAEPIFHIGVFPVTNTLITSWITILILVLVALLITNRAKLIPSRIQGAVEWVIEYMYNFCKDVAGEKNGRKFFPLVTTIFLFVLINALMNLIPGYGTIIITEESHIVEAKALITEINHEHELELDESTHTIAGLINEIIEERVEPLAVGQELTHENLKIEILSMENGEVKEVALKKQVPLLRGANTDINTALSLALISFACVTFWGIKANKGGFFKTFFNFGRFFTGWGQVFRGKAKAGCGSVVFGLIDIFVGILELFSYFIRIVSFTFRLFGNMTGGEILILILFFLLGFGGFGAVSLGYAFEMLVGVVQALIFAGLTLVFATMAVEEHETEEH